MSPPMHHHAPPRACSLEGALPHARVAGPARSRRPGRARAGASSKKTSVLRRRRRLERRGHCVAPADPLIHPRPAPAAPLWVQSGCLGTRWWGLDCHQPAARRRARPSESPPVRSHRAAEASLPPDSHSHLSSPLFYSGARSACAASSANAVASAPSRVAVGRQGGGFCGRAAAGAGVLRA